MDVIKFTLNEVESQAAEGFINEHKNCCKEKSGKEVFSSIGGGFTYIITPTGLGSCISIRCNSCGEVKDITDSESW